MQLHFGHLTNYIQLITLQSRNVVELTTPAKALQPLQTFIEAVSAAITGQWKAILNQ